MQNQAVKYHIFYANICRSYSQHVNCWPKAGQFYADHLSLPFILVTVCQSMSKPSSLEVEMGEGGGGVMRRSL